MNKIIYIDTREKPKAIEKLTKQIEEQGYKIIRSKLYIGDYQLFDSPHVVIDRKKDLQELIGNVTHDHQRFKAELQRANDIGVKVIVLVEHSRQIKTIEDIKYWHNPRLRTSPKATKGTTLVKILETLEAIYGVEFMFCDKNSTGKKIIEILEERSGKDVGDSGTD